MIKEFDIIKDVNNVCGLTVCKLTEYVDIHTYDLYDLAFYLAKENNLRWLNNEKSYVAAFDASDKLIGFYLESCGNIDSCETYNREVVTFLLLSGAKKFIMFHNHPSRSLIYSQGDLKAWDSLQTITNLLDIEFEDSLIIGESGFYSLANKGIVEWDEEDFIEGR